MMELYVSSQTVKLYTPVIAADTLHYLTGRVYFAGDEWNGFAKWLHFRQGEGPDAVVYDVALDENDAFGPDRLLTLSRGEWTVYLTGTKDEARLTTVPLILTVKESGLIDAPLHPMPLSVAEQIDSKASAALACAMELREAAANGAFDGEDGKSFTIKGFYDSFDALAEAVTEPAPGDAYGVGDESPYDIYIWDAVNLCWKNNGAIRGGKGDPGDKGVTFTPSVDASGNLSWTNDGGLENPAVRNIKGPAGAAGAAGAAGKGPYEAAAEHGYTGTEATFYTALAAVPYHNARHLPGGADPITVQTGNLANAAVTTEKLGADAVSKRLQATITTNWTASQTECQQLLSPDGLSSSFSIGASPSAISQVKLLSTGVVLTEGTDYSYSGGTLTFAAVPAAGSNTHQVSWLADAAPYTQTVPVQGLLESDKCLIDAVLPAEIGEAQAILDAYAGIYKITAADGALTVYAMNTTAKAVPITILAVRK